MREKFAAHAAEGRAAAYIAALLDRAAMVADAPGSVQTDDPDDDYLLALAEAHASMQSSPAIRTFSTPRRPTFTCSQRASSSTA